MASAVFAALPPRGHLNTGLGSWGWGGHSRAAAMTGRPSRELIGIDPSGSGSQSEEGEAREALLEEGSLKGPGVKKRQGFLTLSGNINFQSRTNEEDTLT